MECARTDFDKIAWCILIAFTVSLSILKLENFGFMDVQKMELMRGLLKMLHLNHHITRLFWRMSKSSHIHGLIHTQKFGLRYGHIYCCSANFCWRNPAISVGIRAISNFMREQMTHLYFATGSSWSTHVRKLLGLKGISVWNVHHMSLHYLQWTFFACEISLKCHYYDCVCANQSQPVHEAH